MDFLCTGLTALSLQQRTSINTSSSVPRPCELIKEIMKTLTKSRLYRNIRSFFPEEKNLWMGINRMLRIAQNVISHFRDDACFLLKFDPMRTRFNPDSENWDLQNLATAEILIFNWYWTDNWDYNALTSSPQITQRETYAGLTPLNLVNLTPWWL